MRRRILFVLLAGIAACATNGKQDTRKITLTKGDKLSVAVSASGDVTITATIAEGKPDAGVYTTTAPALLDDATAAKNALNRPGATISIHVDDNGEIVVIGYRQVVQ